MAAPDSWLSLCARLGARRAVREVYEDLARHYVTPLRAYHNLAHIEHCRRELAPLKPLAEAPDAVELAVWFHDAIYDPQKPDNELRSAELAWSSVARMGLWAMLGRLSYELVMVTRHEAPPETIDEKIIADVDLSILGAAPAAFDEYERQIREEYGWVSEAEFRVGRTKVLRGFLARPAIFHTEPMAAKYEASARGNLARSIARLESAQ